MEQKIIDLQDGYNGHTVPYFAKPIYEGQSIVWLQCAVPGKGYMKRWAHRSTWLEAIRKANALGQSDKPSHQATVLP